MTAELPNRVIALLYDRAGEFVWVDELANAAGTDPARLEAALAALERRGHRFERSPAHGVRLLRPTVLDAHLIERGLGAGHLGRHVICFREVDSTNDVAFASADQAGQEALVVTAEFQRAGRGRLGRQWRCPPGGGVLISVLLPPAAGGLPLEALTVAAGLAVAEGIELAAGVRATLEWPNDVVIGRAKVAGVLVEVRGQRAVMGIGINVNAAPAPAEVARAVTSLSRAAARPLERIEVCRAVLERVDAWVAALADGRTEQLHRRWVERCEMMNQRVRVVSAGLTAAGRVLDVSPLEGLILLTDDGRRIHLPAATTTVCRDGPQP